MMTPRYLYERNKSYTSVNFVDYDRFFTILVLSHIKYITLRFRKLAELLSKYDLRQKYYKVRPDQGSNS